MIRCQTLGPVDVTVSGGPPPAELLWRKHLALLIYLARAPRRTRTRAQLTGMLWADKEESAARHSLNEALRVLRRAAGDDAVETRGEQVTLQSQAVVLDVDDLERLIGQGDVAGASQLIGGQFLEGFSVPGASELEDWLAAERQHWNARSVAALASHAWSIASAGKPGDAVACASRALRIDPLAEAAVESLIRALVLQGEPAQALARYDQYVSLLQDRLALEPSASLRALAERVRLMRMPHRRTGDAQAVIEERRRLPLVAREPELSALLGEWQAVSSGSGPRVAFVLGDPGTGKTRLGEELCARARLDGGVVSSVRAVTADQKEAQSGVLGLAGGGLLNGSAIAAASPAAIATFADRLPLWEERFPGRKSSAGEREAMPLRQALLDVLRAIGSEQSILLWVDDAQFLDSDSLTDLDALVRDGNGLPFLLLLGVSPVPERSELDRIRARLGRDVTGTVVTLGLLDADAIRGLAAQTLPSYAASDLERLTRRLALDSAGLPLLIVELLNAVANGMDLTGNGSAWPEPMRTLSQTLPGDLPDSITAAIRVGFRRLSREAQSVLAAMSVLGDRVVPGDLALALDQPIMTVAQALDELEWSRWLVAEPRGYSFVARIVKEVVARDMVTAGQRRRLQERRSSLSS